MIKEFFKYVVAFVMAACTLFIVCCAMMKPPAWDIIVFLVVAVGLVVVFKELAFK